MTSIKLDLKKYKSSDNMLQSIAACFPGPVRVLKNKRGKEDGLVDEKRKRIFLIRTEKEYMPKSRNSLRSIIKREYLNRYKSFMGDALYDGVCLLDYDIYMIAAAEYDGEGEWYNWYDIGCLYEPEICRDSIKTEDGKTFTYSVISYFTKKFYLDRYKAWNEAPKETLAKLNHLEKYIFQRTGIDLDCHDERAFDFEEYGYFEDLLADVRWFKNGKPTIFRNDEEFLKEWDGLDRAYIHPSYERVVSIIRNGAHIWDIDVKFNVDDQFEAPTDGDKAIDYVSYSLGKYLHVHFYARFTPTFKGSLSAEIVHERNVYTNKTTRFMPNLSFAGMHQGFATNGIVLSQILGNDYKAQSNTPDHITVVLYHNKKEIFRKDFLVKSCAS